MADQTKFTSKLKGAKIVIIGGSSGIGYSVAEGSVEQGATVIISSSNEARVQKAASQLQKSYPSAASRISSHVCDIGSEDTIESNLKQLLDAATAAGGKIDHIIWTAADPLAIRAIGDIDVATIRKAGTTRFVGPLLLAKLAPKYLAPGPASSITLTTGAVSERPMPDWSVVGSYATGLQGMTRGLALDLKPVRVNIVSPGAVDTALWTMGEEEKQGFFAKIAQATCTGAVASPDDVAEAYLYLMRDRNITGSMISTNGGHLLVGPTL